MIFLTDLEVTLKEKKVNQESKEMYGNEQRNFRGTGEN